MGTWGQEWRYAWRILVRAPQFAILVVTIIAIGVGGITATFALLNAALLRPLPYPESAQMVWLTAAQPSAGINGAPLTMGEVRAWRDHASGVLSGIAFGLTGSTQEIEFYNGSPRIGSVAGMTASSLRTLGARLLLGRGFRREHQPGEVILSYRLWRLEFGASRAAIGSKIALSGYPGRSFTVVGILQHGFDFEPDGHPVDIWISDLTPGRSTASGRYLWAIGVRRPEAGIRQVTAALDAVNEAVVSAETPVERGWRAECTPLRDHMFGPVEPLLILLFTASALVLLIVCANLISINIARLLARSRELAIRVALGATRFSLTRQLIVEAAMPTLGGLVLAVVLSNVILRVLVVGAPMTLAPALRQLLATPFDWRVLGVAGAAATVLQLAVATLSARYSTRLTGWHLKSSRRLRPVFIISQFAVTLVLLVGAALLVRSLLRLIASPLGFEPEHIVSVDLAIRPRPVANATSSLTERGDLILIYNGVLKRLRATPGVIGAALTSTVPLAAWELAERPEEQSAIDVSVISPGYMRMVGTRLVAGREFLPSDSLDLPMRVILNRSAEAELLHGNEGLGSQVRLSRCGLTLAHAPDCLVVGIAQDTRQTSLTSLKPIIYESMLQDPQVGLTAVVRTNGAPAMLIPTLRRVIGAAPPVDGARIQQVGAFTLMSRELRRASAPARYRASLLLVFGTIAGVVAAFGMFSSLHYQISLTTRELGVRAALGASPGRIFRSVLSQASRWIAFGIAVGLLAARAFAGLLRGFLFGISQADVTSYVVGSFVLIVAGLLAAAAPARRAARVDPREMLRHE